MAFTPLSSVSHFDMTFFNIAMSTLVAGAVVLHVFLHSQQLYPWQAKFQHQKPKTFPFMTLPPELRAEVFQYLLEPSEDTSANPTSDSIASTFMPLLFRWSNAIGFRLRESLSRFATVSEREDGSSISTIGRYLGFSWSGLRTAIEEHKQQQKMLKNPTYKHVNTMTLVSKQFGAEFLSVYLNRANMAFMLDASCPDIEAPLRMKAELLRSLRRCQLKIVATPGLANAFDPRDARIRNWELCDAVFLSMRQMTGLKSMTLTIQASGNQLWNPIWLWHFTSQAFKGSEIRAFDRIDFTMKSWPTMGKPNHMKRCAGEGWEWHCEHGHFVIADVREEQDVRSFSQYLYARCRTCEGDEQSSEDEENDD